MPQAGDSARIDLLLVCSAGGHLLQLVALREAWRDRVRLWVTDDAADTRSLLAEEMAVFGDEPSARSIGGFVRGSFRAWKLIRRHRPTAILTTGAGIAVPYVWLGRLLGVDVVYVESVTRIDTPSLTLRLVRWAATSIYVQWPELALRVPRSTFAGTVFAER